MPPPTSTSRARWRSEERRRGALPAAAFLPLAREAWDAYRAHLDHRPGDTCALSLSAMGGCLGIRSDILERAARIAVTFHRVCAGLHARLEKEGELRKWLMEPLRALPSLGSAAASAHFGLDYFRMDFFLDGASGDLRIVEVNSGGAGLNDFLHCIDFLKNSFSFASPPGCHRLDASGALQAIIASCEKASRPIRVLGLVPVENGSTDYVAEYLHYARWLREHTAIRPVFLELREGKLTPFDHPEVPPRISGLGDLDAILCDWFEDLPSLERVQRTLEEHDIAAVPPRSDLLFESKSFLPLLRSLPRPPSIDPAAWELLQSAILPSFPLAEYAEHLAEMRAWAGVVCKMDLDCGSENVHIVDFANARWEDALALLTRIAAESAQSGATWTVQAFVPPPHITSVAPAPWLPNYASHKFDLMTYVAMVENAPHVLFGSREFSREKIDELTEEGKQDSFLSPVCVLPA